MRRRWSAALLGSALLFGCPDGNGDDDVVVPPLVAPLQIQATRVPQAVEGRSFDARFRAIGGVGQGHRWRVASGELPPGVSLVEDGQFAYLRGATWSPGDYECRLAVEDAGGHDASRRVHIRVWDQLGILEPDRPGGLVGRPLTLEFTALGGRGPMTWTVTGSAIPGLVFRSGNSREAALVGTSTVPGDYPIRVEVEDVVGVTAGTSMTVIIARPLELDPGPLPRGTLDEPYQHDFVATEAGGRHVWRVTQGALPPGLRLEPVGALARLRGAPTSTGSFTFDLQVQDGVVQTSTRAFELHVDAPLRLVTSALPSARLGDRYDAPVSVAGGLGPYAFEVRSGALPVGLELVGGPGTSARVVGTAGQVGPFVFEVAVVDAEGREATDILRLEIEPSGVPLTLLPPSPDPLSTCQGGHVVLETRGGSRFGHRWSVQGSLPDGLWLPSTGSGTTALGGVPRTPGRSSVEIRVEDSNGEVATRRFELEVVASLAARWAAVGGARDGQGRAAAALVDLCTDQPAVDRIWPTNRELELAMSPSGRWLAVARTVTSSRAELRLVDLSSSSPVEHAVDTTASAVRDLRFDATGEGLSYVGLDLDGPNVLRSHIRRIELVGATPGPALTLFTSDPGDAHRIRAVSAGGEWIAFGRFFWELRLVSTAGDPMGVVPGDAAPIGFDADADWLLYVEEDVQQRDLARAWSLRAPAPPVVFAPARLLHELFLVPGGRRALLYQDDSPARPWQLYSFTAAAVQEDGPLPGTEVCGAPVALPDGRWAWCPNLQATRFADLSGPNGLVSIGPAHDGWQVFSPGGERLLMQAELDPALGVQTIAYELRALPNPAPLALTPAPPVGGVDRADFSARAKRVLLFGRRGQLSSVHDLSRLPNRSQVWRGQAEPFTFGNPWRNDGSGAFIEIVGALRWLDLTVPDHPRPLPVITPAGVTIPAGGIANDVLVQPDP